jgi:hypothetical protein
MIPRLARNDMIEPTDRHEAIENIEPADATDATERTEPIEPIESTEPFEPMQRIEFCDQSDHFEVRGWTVIRRS